MTAGLATVGLRMPRHPVALELMRAAGVPIAAPSANRFTQLSPTTAEHVREAFGSETPFLLDGGACEVGLESTVIAVTREGLVILRPGMAEVEGALTAVAEEPEGEAHRAPGQHRKHYSPKTQIVLVSRGHLPKEGRGAYLWMDYNAAATLKVRMAREPVEYAAGLYEMLHRMRSRGAGLDCGGDAAGFGGVGGGAGLVGEGGGINKKGARLGRRPLHVDGELGAQSWTG